MTEHWGLTLLSILPICSTSNTGRYHPQGGEHSVESLPVSELSSGQVSRLVARRSGFRRRFEEAASTALTPKRGLARWRRSAEPSNSDISKSLLLPAR